MKKVWKNSNRRLHSNRKLNITKLGQRALGCVRSFQCCVLSFRSLGFLNFLQTKRDHFTLKMASTRVVETSVANNSPSQDSSHIDDHFQSSYVTPRFKHFLSYCFVVDILKLPFVRRSSQRSPLFCLVCYLAQRSYERSWQAGEA